MAKALFLGLPLTGHVNPSLSLVRELVARGDEVVYYAADAFAAKIEAAGARFRPYRNHFLDELTNLPERLDALSWLLTQATAELLQDRLEEFRGERPDYLIADSVAPWGQWVAQILNRPVVTSITTFAINRHVFAFAARSGVRAPGSRFVLSKLRHIANSLRLARSLRRRFGVPGPGWKNLVVSCSDLNIVYTSRYFQPRAETFDGRFHFVGPALTHRRDDSAFPWSRVQHPVLVYVSLGTLFNKDLAFYRHCFEALEGEDCQVILSAAAHPAIVPRNFIVQPHVPQLEVLQRVSAFVTHGGMNSVSESLYNGVPVVVVPQMGEQALVGRRVEQLGAGIYLAKENVSARSLREAVRRILADGSFRSQAAVVRESFLSAGGVSRAADEMIRFTRAPTRGASARTGSDAGSSPAC